MGAFDLSGPAGRKWAAKVLLGCSTDKTPAARRFLRSCIKRPSPLTPRQLEWFGQLAQQAGVTVKGIGK